MLDTLQFLLKNTPLLLKGAWVAILITVLSIALGMVIGVLVAFFRIYGTKPIKNLLYFYEWIMRGLPLLVIIFIIYFGFPSIGINMNGFVAVVLAMGLHSSAYQAQIYRGAILSIGTEQMEAALSQGMSKTMALRYVILPQVVRLSLPGFTNEFTIVLKDSPLAYVVGIAEILKYGREIIVVQARPFEIYLACSILYFVLFHIFYYLFKYIARRYEVPGFLISE